jgi:hypothetical protein
VTRSKRKLVRKTTNNLVGFSLSVAFFGFGIFRLHCEPAQQPQFWEIFVRADMRRNEADEIRYTFLLQPPHEYWGRPDGRGVSVDPLCYLALCSRSALCDPQSGWGDKPEAIVREVFPHDGDLAEHRRIGGSLPDVLVGPETCRLPCLIALG